MSPNVIDRAADQPSGCRREPPRPRGATDLPFNERRSYFSTTSIRRRFSASARPRVQSTREKSTCERQHMLTQQGSPANGEEGAKLPFLTQFTLLIRPKNT